MSDDTESKPPEGPLPTDGINPPDGSDAMRAEIAQSESEEFPEKLYCPQCRRLFPVQGLRAKSNTLLTEAAIVCPRCRRKLRRMKLKDWYDRYVQGQKIAFALDFHGFVHLDPPGEGLNAPENREPPPRLPDRNARPPQGNRNQRGGRNADRGRDPRQNQQPQKKSALPQNIRSYRLPKRRRSR